jgi:transcriptional regulator with XRE-family HTH domain
VAQLSADRTTTHKARLGQALRAIRSGLRLTLAETSARTGLAVSTLSKVENGQLSLTYDKLVQLSEGLEIDISTFFDPAPHDTDGPTSLVTARRSIARRGEGLLVETPNYDYRYLCTDLSRKGMVPILITIRARSTEKLVSFSSHSGEEFIHVLRGTIELHTEFYAPTLLAPGDSIYIDSRMKHASLSTGRRAATVLNVCWSPSAGHFRTLYELALSGADRPKEPERGLPKARRNEPR